MLQEQSDEQRDSGVDASIFAAILDHFPFAFVRVGRDGVIRKAGGAGLERAGIDPEEAVGKRVRDLLSSDLEDRVLRAVEGGPQSFQTRDENDENGGYFSHFVFYQPHRDEIIGIAVDITNEVATKEALERSEAKYRTLFENASDGIFLFELDAERMPSRIVEVNNVAVKRLGYSREELCALNPAALDAPEFDVDIPQTMDALYSKGTEQLEFLHLAKDGTRIPVEVSSHLVQLDGEDYLLSIARDVTERREYERRLRASIEEKEVLLGEIHHRVKNNLQIVSSMLHIEAGRSNEEQRDATTVLRETQARVQAMAVVHEVIYSVGTAAHVDLGEYLPRLVDNVKNIYMGSGALRYHADCTSVEVDLDRAVPIGLFVNEAVTNAVQHAFPDGRQQGSIMLRVTDREETIGILVTDDGVGLPEDVSIDSPSIGMMLMRNLGDQLHGRVQLQSNPDDHGTRLVLEIPHRGGS